MDGFLSAMQDSLSTQNSNIGIVLICIIIIAILFLIYKLVKRIEKQVLKEIYEIKNKNSSLEEKIHDEKKDLKSMVDNNNAEIKKLFTSLESSVSDLKRETNGTKKDHEGKLISLKNNVEQILSEIPERQMQTDIKSTTIFLRHKDPDEFWMNAVKQWNSREECDLDGWNIMGIVLENIGERQLNYLHSPRWSIGGASESELDDSTFWLVGYEEGPFEFLAPSRNMILRRSLWLQSGSGTIRALFSGIYKWTPTPNFGLKRLARIEFDEENIRPIVKEDGEIHLDI